jgi:hypothetical protein
MVYLFASLILISICLVLLIFNQDAQINLNKRKSIVDKGFVLESKLNSYLQEKFPIFLEVFDSKVMLKLIFPAIAIFFFFAFVVNPKMTNVNFAFVLAVLMVATYALRIYYHNLSNFRTSLLSQIKQLFFNIRNHLSTGVSLDQALSQNLAVNYKQPLRKEFHSFVGLAQTNLIENFPSWLIKIQRIYKLQGLDKVAQILQLELKYNNNQEEAFEKAIEAISQRVEQNTRQKNSIFISLTTIDFLTLMFFGLMFFVIPTLRQADSLWWASFHRELVVFGSAGILWSLYFASLIYLVRRLA